MKDRSTRTSRRGGPSKRVSSVAGRYDSESRGYDALYRAEQEGKLALLVKAGWAPAKKVLDVGCGTALLTARMAKDCDLAAGIDLSLGMLGVAKKRKRVELVLADAALVPFRSTSFGSVTCFTAFHHFRRKSCALAEMARVVENGGSVVISTLDTGPAAAAVGVIERCGSIVVRRKSKNGNDVLLVAAPSRGQSKPTTLNRLSGTSSSV